MDYNDDANRQLALQQLQNQNQPANTCNSIVDYIKNHKLLVIIIILLIIALIWWFFLRKKTVEVNVNTPGNLNGATASRVQVSRMR